LNKRTLIFGGTFDPPHLAHTTLAALAAAQLECEEILFIPAAINPLKAGNPSATNQHRLAMLRLAIAEIPKGRISAIELYRPGPSYTVDTLRELTKLGGEASTSFLLIGADQALDFHRWKEWQEILRLATPAVMVRPPWTTESLFEALLKTYSKSESERWQQRTLRLPLMDISATEIRRRIKAGEPASGLLHPTVEAYIHAHGLYR